MAAITKLKPNFTRIGNGGVLQFDVKELNYLMEEQVIDNYNWYQRCFNVFGNMRLTSKLKHTIHWVKSSPMIWQPHKSCRIDPTGNITTGKQSMNPCNATAFTEVCYDALFNSCFEGLLSWNGSNPVSWTATQAGREMIQQVYAKILQSMAIGGRMTLTANGLHDFSKVEFAKGVTEEVKNLFKLTSATCEGWVSALKKLGDVPGYGHLNIAGLLTPDLFNGAKFIGDVEKILRGLQEEAKHDLQCVIDEGIGGGFDVTSNGTQPLYLFSTYLFKAVVQAYHDKCEDNFCQNKRFDRIEKTEGGQTRFVYTYDGIPIIPIHDVNWYEKYLLNKTHFAVLTTAGQINLGSSFNAIEQNIANPDMAVRIEIKDSNAELGITTVRADALFSTLFADTDFMTAAVLQTQVAA